MFLVIRYKKKKLLICYDWKQSRVVERLHCTLKTAYSKKIFEQCFLKQIEKTSSKYVERHTYKTKDIYDLNINEKNIDASKIYSFHK